MPRDLPARVHGITGFNVKKIKNKKPTLHF
jgi:hypothetical protein